MFKRIRKVIVIKGVNHFKTNELRKELFDIF